MDSVAEFFRLVVSRLNNQARLKQLNINQKNCTISEEEEEEEAEVVADEEEEEKAAPVCLEGGFCTARLTDDEEEKNCGGDWGGCENDEIVEIEPETNLCELIGAVGVDVRIIILFPPFIIGAIVEL